MKNENARIRELISLRASAEEKYYSEWKQTHEGTSQIEASYVPTLAGRAEKKARRRNLVRSSVGIAAGFALVILLCNPGILAIAGQAIIEWGRSFADVQVQDENIESYVPAFSLSYIPAGYTPSFENDGSLIRVHDYKNGADEIEVSVSLLNTDFSVNSEHVRREDFTWNGKEVLFLKSDTKDYYSSLFMIDQDRKLVTYISAPYNLEKEEFVKILDGIRLEE